MLEAIKVLNFLYPDKIGCIDNIYPVHLPSALKCVSTLQFRQAEMRKVLLQFVENYKRNCSEEEHLKVDSCAQGFFSSD